MRNRRLKKLLNCTIPAMIPENWEILKSPEQFYAYLDIVIDFLDEKIRNEIEAWHPNNPEKCDKQLCQYWNISCKELSKLYFQHWQKRHPKAVENIRKFAETWVNQNIDESFWGWHKIQCIEFEQPPQIHKFVSELRQEKLIPVSILAEYVCDDAELHQSLIENNSIVLDVLRDMYWDYLEQAIEHQFCERVKKKREEYKRRKISADNFAAQTRIRNLAYGNLKSLYESENSLEWVNDFLDLGGSCKRLSNRDVHNFNAIYGHKNYILISSGLPFIVNAEDTMHVMKTNHVNKLPELYMLEPGSQDSVAVNFQNREYHNDFIREIRSTHGRIQYQQMILKYILYDNNSVILPMYVLFENNKDPEILYQAGIHLSSQFRQNIFYYHQNNQEKLVTSEGIASKLPISNHIESAAELLSCLLFNKEPSVINFKNIQYFRPAEPPNAFYMQRRLNRYEALW